MSDIPMRERLATVLCERNSIGGRWQDYLADADAVLDALRTPTNQDEWQPIETAPKDGETLVLAIRADAKVPFVATGDDDGWFTFNGALENCGQKFEPTHWMPLPPPPIPEHFIKVPIVSHDEMIRDLDKGE